MRVSVCVHKIHRTNAPSQKRAITRAENEFYELNLEKKKSQYVTYPLLSIHRCTRLWLHVAPSYVQERVNIYAPTRKKKKTM